MKAAAYLVILGLGAAFGAGPLPSCEDDVGTHCLGDGGPRTQHPPHYATASPPMPPTYATRNGIQ